MRKVLLLAAVVAVFIPSTALAADVWKETLIEVPTQTWEDAVEKFTTLAASDVAETALAEIVSAVHDLEHITVAELTRLLGHLAAPAQSGALDAA